MRADGFHLQLFKGVFKLLHTRTIPLFVCFFFIINFESVGAVV